MRVPSLFRARSYAAAPAGTSSAPPRGEAGSDGESWIGDYIGGGPDVNPELSGSAKFEVFDEMAMTDPSVKSTLMFLLLPPRSAVWSLDPKTDDPEAKLIADAAAWQFGLEGNIGELDLSWDELMQQGLGQIMRMGPCIEELVWDDARQWRDADGDQHLLRPLARVALRPAATITKVVREKGRVVQVEQDASNARPIVSRDPLRPKLSYMVFERKGNRWDGESLLRPMWGPWMLKKALMLSAGMGWDRFAFGIPEIYHPDTPDGEDKARLMGRNLQAHERAYMHFPVGEGDTWQESQWHFDIKSGAASLADPVPLLRFYTEQIYEAGMEQFARQGFGQTGARATSETQVDPYFLAVQALAGYYRRERLRQLIRPWVVVNFGVEAAERWTPELTVSKIQARSVDTISRAIALLAPAGLTLADQDWNDVRELLGFGQIKGAAEVMGTTPAALEQALTAAGLDAAQVADIVNALPEGVGVQRNRVTPEGDGLARAAQARRRAQQARDDKFADLERRFEQVERDSVKPPEMPITVKLEEGDTHVHLPERLVEVNEGDTHVAAPEIKLEQPALPNVVVNVAGERRPTRALTRKDGDQTVIDYEYEEDGRG